MEYAVFIAGSLVIVLIIMAIHSALYAGAMNGIEAIEEAKRKKSGKNQKSAPEKLQDRYK